LFQMGPAACPEPDAVIPYGAGTNNPNPILVILL
jgi:hypothetical protein